MPRAEAAHAHPGRIASPPPVRRTRRRRGRVAGVAGTVPTPTVTGVRRIAVPERLNRYRPRGRSAGPLRSGHVNLKPLPVSLTRRCNPRHSCRRSRGPTTVEVCWCISDECGRERVVARRGRRTTHRRPSPSDGWCRTTSGNLLDPEVLPRVLIATGGPRAVGVLRAARPQVAVASRGDRPAASTMDICPALTRRSVDRSAPIAVDRLCGVGQNRV